MEDRDGGVCHGALLLVMATPRFAVASLHGALQPQQCLPQCDVVVTGRIVLRHEDLRGLFLVNGPMVLDLNPQCLGICNRLVKVSCRSNNTHSLSRAENCGVNA